MPAVSFDVAGIPTDMVGARKLAREKPFEFEKWAIARIPGMLPNAKQVRDGGIDGTGTLLDRPEGMDSSTVIAQVKGGRWSISPFRDFLGQIDRRGAVMGIYFTVEPTSSHQARALAASLGTFRFPGSATEYPRAQLWSIAEYLRGVHPKIPALADPFTGKAVQSRLSLF